MSERVTFLVGAGTPLDLELPSEIIRPTTANITEEACRDYSDYRKEHTAPETVVRGICDRLRDRLPIKKNPCVKKPDPSKADVNFEQIFHVLEELYAYRRVWEEKCKALDRYPILAPFIQPNFDFDGEILYPVMKVKEYILRIMDIVSEYDSYFRTQIEEGHWYRCFFKSFKDNGDFFTLNYDTTIEESIKIYEDGYVEDGIQKRFKRFDAKQLFGNPNKLSTINHLHGCINYFFQSYKDINTDVYRYLNHDLYKYDDYKDVRKMMVGHGHSQASTQSGETYYSAPIVTGLRKTDKLNCAPFDFYHSHLVNCVIRSNKLVVSGYSFGDLYCNQLIERMHMLHGNKRRIVLIDSWDIPEDFRNRHGGCWLSQHSGTFLCRAAECGDFNTIVKELYSNEDPSTGALFSNNGCLMVMPQGFKHAAGHASEIEAFLNS